MSLFIRFSGQGRAIAVPSMGLIPVAMLGRPLLVRILAGVGNAHTSQNPYLNTTTRC